MKMKSRFKPKMNFPSVPNYSSIETTRWTDLHEMNYENEHLRVLKVPREAWKFLIDRKTKKSVKQNRNAPRSRALTDTTRISKECRAEKEFCEEFEGLIEF